MRPYFPADRGERRRGGKWGLYVQLLNVACHLRNCDQKRLLLQKLIPETANERNQILEVGGYQMVKRDVDQRERVANSVVIIDSIQKSSKNMETESRTTRAV